MCDCLASLISDAAHVDACKVSVCFAFSGLFALKLKGHCLLFSVTKSPCCVDLGGGRGGSVNECGGKWLCTYVHFNLCFYLFAGGGVDSITEMVPVAYCRE